MARGKLVFLRIREIESSHGAQPQHHLQKDGRGHVSATGGASGDAGRAMA